MKVTQTPLHNETLYCSWAIMGVITSLCVRAVFRTQYCIEGIRYRAFCMRCTHPG